LSVRKQQPLGTPSARETSERSYTGMGHHSAGKIYSRLPFGFGEEIGNKLFGRIHHLYQSGAGTQNYLLQ
jgi:hypothetical protein